MGAEVLALVIGYLLGSIPTAYIVTRIATGRDMGATFGVLFVLMRLYRYWFGVLIFIATIGAAFLVTRNVGISMGTGLLFLPLIVWQMAGALMPVLLAIATGM